MDAITANNYLQSILPIFTLTIEGMPPIHIFYNGYIDGLGDKAFGVNNKIPAVVTSIITSNIEK